METIVAPQLMERTDPALPKVGTLVQDFEPRCSCAVPGRCCVM